MKKTIKILMMLMMCAIIAITAVPATASAATNGTIDIKANIVTISKGSKYQIKAVIGGIVVKSQGKWKSSKPAVATVSKTGLVTAKTAGTTTVKVVYNGKSQSIKVKVVTTCKHTWKTTKKATCETTGKKLCTICGKNSTIKMTECNWKTVK